MKYRLEGTTFEAIDTYVRITIGGTTVVSDKECPKSTEVAAMLERMQGYSPNRAQLQDCSRVANDARDNKDAKELIL
jgi:hypothetical protein